MTDPTRVGELRPSQLLYTYGVGAAVDLPNVSAMVMGLDEWDVASAAVVSEERLLAAVRGRLGKQVSALRLPPWMPQTADVLGDWAKVGVPASPFPRWLRCPRCSYLGSISTGLLHLKTSPWRPDQTQYEHHCSPKGRQPTALPVRFLLACPRGHMDEFPWVEYVHRGTPCKAPLLNLYERGVTGRAAEILVSCKACEVKDRSLADAFERGTSVLPKCRGRHPHLAVREECSNQTSVILLGASNAWFPITLSVVSIPRSADPIDQRVAKLWNVLGGITGPEILAYARSTNIDVATAFAGIPDSEVLEAIERQRQSAEAVDDEDVDILGPEWEVLSDPGAAPSSDDFKLREVAVPRGFEDSIERVVLVERLREVVALLGFTRVEPPDEVEAMGEEAGRAPLSRKAPEWLPAAEVRGEGIFLQLNEETVADWEERVRGTEPIARHVEANRDWCVRRGMDPDVRWPGPRYLLLHSLAHVLMREFALESGYSAASIRERLYARGGTAPMAGLLIYTAASDSEGTLGGLVSLGEPRTLSRMLELAKEHAKLCSSDPMCAEHDPVSDGSLHGAACHACMFTSETSCERGNRYLDRTVLVPTLLTSSLALFE